MTEQEEQLQERLDVILALAIDSSEKTSPCPDDDELVAWHEKTLPDERRQEIAAHLAGCTSCYLVWSDLAMLTELPATFVEPVPESTKQSTVVQAKTRSNFSEWLGALFRPGVWVTGGFGTAIAALMLVFVLLPTLRMNSVEQSINEGFAALPDITSGPLLPSVLPEEKQPEYASKSLFPLETISKPSWHAATPMQEAFAVGVAKGLHSLSALDSADTVLLGQLPGSISMNPANVSERAWKRRKNALVQAGRWAVLVNHACSQSSGASPSFLSKQEPILSHLTQEITAYPDKDQYTFFFDSWANAPEQEKDMCGRAKALLGMGLEQ